MTATAVHAQFAFKCAAALFAAALAACGPVSEPGPRAASRSAGSAEPVHNAPPPAAAPVPAEAAAAAAAGTSAAGVEAPAIPAADVPRYDPSLPAEVPVAGDLVALAAHGPVGSSRAIVYLHGVCGDVTKYRAWSEAGVRFGTVVAVRGDDRCKESGRFKWGASVKRTDERIVAAVRAVGAVRGGLDTESVTLVGYSQGSARAEALVRAFPSRYRRAVLVAGPLEHEPASFRGAAAIAVVAGALDLKKHLQDAAEKAARAGVHARYFELPGARHGDYGPEGARVMGEVLAWVLADTAPPRAAALSQALR